VDCTTTLCDLTHLPTDLYNNDINIVFESNTPFPQQINNIIHQNQENKEQWAEVPGHYKDILAETYGELFRDRKPKCRESGYFPCLSSMDWVVTHMGHGIVNALSSIQIDELCMCLRQVQKEGAIDADIYIPKNYQAVNRTLQRNAFQLPVGLIYYILALVYMVKYVPPPSNTHNMTH